MSGALAHHTGVAAEDIVARAYSAAGHTERHRRWRGRGGEIDLVFQDADGIVFVEVKAGRSIDSALRKLSPRQVTRICAAAAEFASGEPGGQDTPMRIDLAAVDRAGRVRIVENILI